MGAVEQSVPIAQKLQSEGVGGIWQDIVEKVGDLKTKLFSKISEYLIPTVLIAGITWIISLLNPASAFIKACKMIVDIVTFIVQRGAQIVQFVNAVLDAIIAIAGGGAGGVPALIEKALVLSIPVLIGALAAILGIGGIAEKVKKFFQALSKPVMKAVDFVVDKIVKLGKGVWAKLKAGIGKAKDKFGRGGKDQPDGAAPARGAERLAIAAAERLLSTKPDEEQVRHQLPGISRRHGTPLSLVVDSRQPATSRVHVQTMSTDQHDIPPARPGELEQLDAVLGRPRVDALCESLGEAKVINLVKDLGPYGVQKLADGLSDSDVGALLGTLDPSLPAKIFKGRQPATGVEFKKLFDRFGATDVNLLAAALGGKLALIVKWDMFQFHATQQQRLDANQGHTARSMPPLFGRTVSDVWAILTARGMTLAHAEPDHEMWTHPDHSVVRLKTGPAAHGPHTPFNHVVLEVTKTAGDVDIDEVYAKVTESGQPAPQGTKQAEDQLAAWFKARVGRLPRPNELDAMMSMWGKVTHIKLQ